jgi:hypothetical protein
MAIAIILGGIVFLSYVTVLLLDVRPREQWRCSLDLHG